MALKSRLIAVLKKEFPEEVEDYEINIRTYNFEAASNCVHKLKHKIGLLGLENGYKEARVFEDNLKNDSNEFQSNFEEILNSIKFF